MSFIYQDRCLPLRAPAKIARELFRAVANSGATRDNTGIPGSSTRNVFDSIINPAEYSPGQVFAMANDSTGDINAPKGFLGATGKTYIVNNAYGSPNAMVGTPSMLSSSIPDNVSGCSEIRGYLQPITLAQFCTELGLSQTAGRLYQTNWLGTPYGYLTVTPLLNADGTLINEYEMFANKIVPVITWYYTDASGNRVSKIQAWSFDYYFTSNAFNQAQRKSIGVPGGGTTYQRLTTRVTINDVLYYSITPPYVKAKVKNGHNVGATLNGYVARANQEDDVLTVSINTAPYYDFVAVAKTPTTKISKVYAVNGGSPYSLSYVCSGFPDNTFTRVPLFNSIDDIVNLFADFGVVVTTDWDEVLNPTPTPEESATPNPDPTDREIPSFPDNTTDTTPIEQAYITPSTFGQSCVYNPTTTRDFLAWVCDSTVNIDNWARLFANPADVITGINLYNLDIVAHDAAHVEAKTETNILGVTTPIPNYAILGGYNNIVDGGTLHLQAYYGNYADFTSMTYQMYVPFVGFTTLRACDVVNKTLHLYYAVDFATGSAVAFVNSDDKLIYTSPCTVAGKIPLSTSDRNSQMINNTLSVLGGLSGLLGGVASGNVGGGVGALMGGLGGLQMQTNYSNKGSLSSVNIYKLIPAFVERTRYDLFMPSNDSAYINAKYQSAAGAPSTQFDTLLNCVDAGGFVQSDVVYLTSQTATETEKQQIIDLIKSGIYL